MQLSETGSGLPSIDVSLHRLSSAHTPMASVLRDICLLQHYHLILIKTEPRTAHIIIAKYYLLKAIALYLNHISVKEC